MINKFKKCFSAEKKKDCKREELISFVEWVLRSTECLIGYCPKQSYSHKNETYKIKYDILKKVRWILWEKDIIISRTKFIGNEYIIEYKTKWNNSSPLKTINIVEI